MIYYGIRITVDNPHVWGGTDNLGGWVDILGGWVDNLGEWVGVDILGGWLDNRPVLLGSLFTTKKIVDYIHLGLV